MEQNEKSGGPCRKDLYLGSTGQDLLGGGLHKKEILYISTYNKVFSFLFLIIHNTFTSTHYTYIKFDSHLPPPYGCPIGFEKLWVLIGIALNSRPYTLVKPPGFLHCPHYLTTSAATAPAGLGVVSMINRYIYLSARRIQVSIIIHLVLSATRPLCRDQVSTYSTRLVT